MKFENSLWWPSSEKHLTEFGLSYQSEVRERAMALSPGHGLCLDIGAHVGIASIHFAKTFNTALAFEPIPETFSCLTRNVTEHNVGDKVLPINCALSHSSHPLRFSFNPGNTGYTVPHEEFTDLAHHYTIAVDQIFCNPQLVKIDVEGFEANVLKGMKMTLQRCSPVFILEVKGVGEAAIRPDEPLQILQQLGYSVVEQHYHDFILKR